MRGSGTELSSYYFQYGGFIKSLHRTKELGQQIREALEQGDLDRFGELMDVHWQNKKRRSGKISDPRIDEWYELTRDTGAVGGKLIGAGWRFSPFLLSQFL